MKTSQKEVSVGVFEYLPLAKALNQLVISACK